MKKLKLTGVIASTLMLSSIIALTSIEAKAQEQYTKLNTMKNIYYTYKGSETKNKIETTNTVYFKDHNGKMYGTGDVSLIFAGGYKPETDDLDYIRSDGGCSHIFGVDKVYYTDENGKEREIGGLDESLKSEDTDSTEENKDIRLTSVGASEGWTTKGPGDLKYIDPNGTPHEGWLNYRGKTYYCSGGCPETRFLVKGEKTYFFKDSGELFKEVPTVKGVVESFVDKDQDGVLDEQANPNSAYRNMRRYYVDGLTDFKHFNDDGTVAKNTLFQPIENDGKDSIWTITDKYGYSARYKTKLEVNGKTYFQIDDGWNTNSDTISVDPDTGEEVLVKVDTSLGKTIHPHYIAKNEWGIISGAQWCHSDSEGRIEKNVWMQNDAKTKWYYLNEKGMMVRYKWLQIGGDWYYFENDGTMATNTTIGIDGYTLGADHGYTVGADGKMI